MLKVTRNYLLKNKLMAFIGLYFFGSTILKSVSGIDICIPCIWKTLFGLECPGCGLTRAFIHLINFNFIEAFRSNWLIYVVLPLTLFFIGKDFHNFYKKQVI